MGAALQVLASHQDDLITELLRGNFISFYANGMFNMVTRTNQHFRPADLCVKVD